MSSHLGSRRRRTAPPRTGSTAIRLRPVLGGIAAVAIFFVLTGGRESGGGVDMRLLSLVLLALTGLALTHIRRGPALAERPWSAPAPAAAAAAAPAARDRSAAPPAWSVAFALGRVEARQLATSGWFGVGVAFCALILWLFGWEWGEDYGTWEQAIGLAPWFALPFVGPVVVGSHRAATRAARDGAGELFESCPTDPATRTLGFLLTAAVPVATLGVFFALLGTGVAIRSPFLHGPVGPGRAAEVVAAVVLGAAGVALGVALSRWARFGAAPVVAVVAIGFVSTAVVNGWARTGWKPLAPLSVAPTVYDMSPVFTDPPPFWHLLWVTGLTGAVGVLAVARFRRDRTVAVAASVSALLVLVAGIGATRPLPAASAALIADRVAHPEAHQDCTATDGPVEVCGFPLHRELLGRVAERVTPVAAALPPGLAPLTLRQTFDHDLGDLPPEVRRLLTDADLVRPGDEVALDFEDPHTATVGDAAFDVAFAALGLPTRPDRAQRPTVIAGQARGVVAIWLATRGLDARDALRAVGATDPQSADAFDRGSLDGALPCLIPAVVWSGQDLAAARAVLDLPAAGVTAVVRDGWARWTNPGTGTDELLAALGLPAAGPFDQVVARPGEGC